MMIKYTFIFEYEGDTYIKQVAASELKQAIDIWTDLIGPEIPEFNKTKKTQLLKETQFYDPDPIIGMENVCLEPSSILCYLTMKIYNYGI